MQPLAKYLRQRAIWLFEFDLAGPLLTTDFAVEMSRISTPTILIRRLLALGMTALVVWSVVDFPIWSLEIGFFLALVAGAILYRANAWLVIVPAALPVFDLAPWSGRFIWDEFDFLVLTVLAATYWSRGYGNPFPRLIGRQYILINLMMFFGVVSFSIGFFPLQRLAPNDWYDYLGPLNALRVGKGILWAWLLFPLLAEQLSRDFSRSTKASAAGVLLGLVFCSLIVLWERGVFASLYTLSIYGLLGSILDFTWGHRATAWFSSMHTGGSAIDGYLALTVGFAIAMLFVVERDLLRILVAIAAAAGIYAAVATFSRGLYGAIALSFVAAVFLAYRQHGNRDGALLRYWLLAVAMLAVTFILQYFLFASGGFQAVGIGIMLLFVNCGGGYLRQVSGSRFVTLISLATTVALEYWLWSTISESKHTETSTFLMATLIVAALFFLAIPAFVVGQQFLSRNNLVISVTALSFLSAIWLLGIPAASGYKMTERFGSSSQDLGSREKHYLRTLKIMPGGLSYLLGAGSGSFPKIYWDNFPSTRAPKNARDRAGLCRYVVASKGPDYLSLSSGRHVIQQRVASVPKSLYDLRISARSRGGTGRLFVRLCEKNIIHSNNTDPRCIGRKFSLKNANVFTNYRVRLNSGYVGRRGLAFWSPPVVITNTSANAVIDISNIQLIDTDGKNLIRNGSFALGGDHWLFASDFEHLAWHPKNIFLFVFFEQGLFGLLAFSALMVFGIWSQFSWARTESTTALVVLPVILSLLGVGIFGTIIDTPKIATFAYLILFIGVTPIKGRGFFGTAVGEKSMPADRMASKRVAAISKICTIRLYSDQIRFLRSFRKQLGTGRSEALQAIIDIVFEEIKFNSKAASGKDHHERVVEVLKNRQPSLTKIQRGLDDQMRKINVKLRPDQIELLTSYAQEIDMTLSRAVRRFVGYFAWLREKEELALENSGDPPPASLDHNKNASDE